MFITFEHNYSLEPHGTPLFPPVVAQAPTILCESLPLWHKSTGPSGTRRTHQGYASCRSETLAMMHAEALVWPFCSRAGNFDVFCHVLGDLVLADLLHHAMLVQQVHEGTAGTGSLDDIAPKPTSLPARCT
jgi:hypothetical protein